MRQAMRCVLFMPVWIAYRPRDVEVIRIISPVRCVIDTTRITTIEIIVYERAR